MGFTENWYLAELSVAPVDWVSVFNANVAKLEAGPTIKITAAENLAAYDTVTIGNASGKHSQCDNTGSFLGIATAAIALDAEGYVWAGMGFEITNGSWSWTRSALLYVHTVAGSLSESDPGSGAIPIAYAHTTTSIILCRPQITGLD